MKPIVHKKALKKIGNSHGITFNKTHLEMMGWDTDNTLLEISYDTVNQRVIIEKRKTGLFAKKGDFESGT